MGITELEITSGSAKMNGNLVISVYFGDLPKELVDDLENNMAIKVNNLISYELTQEQFKNMEAGIKKIRNDNRKMLTIILSAVFPLDLTANPAYLPFDLLNLKLSIKLSSVHTTFLGKRTTIDFNIMYAYKKTQANKKEEQDE